MAKQTDIDIDMADRELLLKHIKHIPASMINGNIIKKHNVGVYLQKIPTFLDTGLASIDYKDAGDYGYFKMDVLNNSIYEMVKSEEHLDRLMAEEPDWNMLLDAKVVDDLFQIAKYHELLCVWKPKTVYELAMFIAMIRPAKKHLVTSKSWSEVEKEIWQKPSDESAYFKKSHSIAYAMVIVVQLNLIRESKRPSSNT